MKLHKYKYEALSANNKLVKGSYEAINQYTCIKYLESKSLTVKKITEINSLITKLNQITISNVLSRKQLIFFLKQLGALLKAGINILTALEILALQQDNKYLRRLFFELHQNIANGLNFSEALAEKPKEFPRMLVQMIEIGEISGNLPEAILNMADYYEKQMKISAAIKGTIRMPLIYLGITILVAIGMVLFVFPNIANLFDSFNAELPPVTVFFLGASSFIGDYYLQGILLILITVIAVYLLNRFSPQFRYGFNALLLKLPIFGKLIQMYNQILIASTLSQMLSHGINSLRALKAIKELLNNVVYVKVIEATIKNISDGKAFSKAFKESDFIDPIMSRMIETGENTGDIPTLMVNLSNYYNDMSNMRVEKIKGALQPILLVIIYSIIAVMLLAILLPMMDLGGQI